jgi:hypothetical protein
LEAATASLTKKGGEGMGEVSGPVLTRDVMNAEINEVDEAVFY